MSTFSGFIPELPGIAIDRFEEEHRSKACMFFLSHCHADHMRGLDTDVPLPGAMYLSPISGVFIKHRFPQHAAMVRTFNIREEVALKIAPPSGEDAYELFVRCFPADHCPGSVMLYFETTSIRVLYTGDFRLISQIGFEAQSAGLHPQIVYLDSTFLDMNYSYFPSRDASTGRILLLCAEWLAADKQNVILLWLPANYGSEDLFIRLYKELKEKIHISEMQRGTYMHFPSLADVLTCDSSARIHACNGTTRPTRRLPCRDQSDADGECFVRTIRPSALRWRGLQPSEPYWKESNNLFYVCYSAHASCDELGRFMRYVRYDMEQVRFNVVADEADQREKERIVEYILADKSTTRMYSVDKNRTIFDDPSCLFPSRIDFSRFQSLSRHVTETAESNDKNIECKLPKKGCDE